MEIISSGTARRQEGGKSDHSVKNGDCQPGMGENAKLVWRGGMHTVPRPDLEGCHEGHTPGTRPWAREKTPKTRKTKKKKIKEGVSRLGGKKMKDNSLVNVSGQKK